MDYENGTVETDDSFIPDDSNSLIDGPMGPEGVLELAVNGVPFYPGVVDDGLFHSLSVPVDFGTGYDFIGVLFYGENGAGGIMQLDNADFVIEEQRIPEPATLSLLSLGGLALLRRRKRL